MFDTERNTHQRAAFSAFVDLYFAIYPSTVLMKLHMSLRKRVALCAALGLGAMYASIPSTI